jgi:hypothetical protein
MEDGDQKAAKLDSRPSFSMPGFLLSGGQILIFEIEPIARVFAEDVA